MKRLLLTAILLGVMSLSGDAAFLKNLCSMSTATTGTGTVTLGSASTGYLSFDDCGVTNGLVVTYAIQSGTAREIGRGTYTTSGTTLSRDTILESTNAGSAVSLTGTSTVFLTPSAEDLQTLQTMVEGGVINWDSGDATLTQSGDTMTWAGITSFVLGTSTVATLGSIELGASTDTTVARSGAGEATIETDAIKHAGKQVMWIPASSMKGNASNPASCGDTYDSGSNDVTIWVCAFDTGATEERADFQIAMPKAWDEGTLTFIPISTCVTCTASQTIQYELACVAISNTDSMNAAMGSAVTSSVTVSTGGNVSQVGAESSAMTCAGTPAQDDYVAFRVSRDTSVDNGTGDALLLGVKVFWTDNASTLAE